MGPKVSLSRRDPTSEGKPAAEGNVARSAALSGRGEGRPPTVNCANIIRYTPPLTLTLSPRRGEKEL